MFLFSWRIVVQYCVFVCHLRLLLFLGDNMSSFKVDKMMVVKIRKKQMMVVKMRKKQMIRDCGFVHCWATNLSVEHHGIGIQQFLFVLFPLARHVSGRTREKWNGH